MSHYFAERPYYSRLKVRQIEVVIRGQVFRFVTAPGVFSPKHVDAGTLLLAESMELKDGVTVLDLGCGYGVLGIVYAKLCPSSMVYMVDINEQSLHLAKMNAKLNNVRNVKIKKSDLYSNIDDLQFDVVICNPPISAGLELNYRLIEETWKHLKDGGLFQVVYPLKMSDRFEQKLKEYFKSVRTAARTGTHRVLIAEK